MKNILFVQAKVDFLEKFKLVFSKDNFLRNNIIQFPINNFYGPVGGFLSRYNAFCAEYSRKGIEPTGEMEEVMKFQTELTAINTNCDGIFKDLLKKQKMDDLQMQVFKKFDPKTDKKYPKYKKDIEKDFSEKMQGFFKAEGYVFPVIEKVSTYSKLSQRFSRMSFGSKDEAPTDLPINEIKPKEEIKVRGRSSTVYESSSNDKKGWVKTLPSQIRRSTMDDKTEMEKSIAEQKPANSSDNDSSMEQKGFENN